MTDKTKSVSTNAISDVSIDDPQSETPKEHSRTLDELIAERAKWTREDRHRWYKQHMVWKDWDNLALHESDEEDDKD